MDLLGSFVGFNEFKVFSESHIPICCCKYLCHLLTALSWVIDVVGDRIAPVVVCQEKFKIKPQIIIKMGDKVDEIIKFLKEDKSIRFLILASSIDSDPGPIIKSLSKKMNDLPVPLVIIPGLISEKELDNLI